MGVKIITGPAVEPLGVSDTASYLRVTDPEEFGLIEEFIAAARGQVDNFLNRALITQTLEYYSDEWPEPYDEDCLPAIRIPAPPLIGVSWVKYYDMTGVLQTLDPNSYFVDNSPEVGRVVLNYGRVWPIVLPHPQAITVRYTAGYGAAGTDVPAVIRQALRLAVAEMYENRGPSKELPEAVQMLLHPLRIVPL
jgi:uncharacterized phiE125 gp8 family phage protein